MLTSGNLAEFKSPLETANRTTSDADEVLDRRYVEFIPGVISQLEAEVNHYISGRRGVGKSTTLSVLQKRAEAHGIKVLFIDIQAHKDRSYPDVLIELMIDILTQSRPKGWWGPRGRLRRDINRSIKVLSTLAGEPLEATVTREGVTSLESELSGSVGGGVRLPTGVAKTYARLAAGVSGRRMSNEQVKKLSSQTLKKEDYLRNLAPVIADLLERNIRINENSRMILVLDDFYFIPRAAQPYVLDHLHGVTKRSNVWLKIGSVAARTATYKEGDPPIGMQTSHDMRPISLDVGLDRFSVSKKFLEQVADGVLQPAGMSVATTVTETARDRAVLLCGGAVVRDYINLLVSAADFAWARSEKMTPGQSFQINAEDLQEAARSDLQRKISDMRSDTGRDARALEARFDEIVNFARDRQTYFFLVRRDAMDTFWGRQILELEDLRMVHKIAVLKPNTEKWKGVDTIVYMVDIPSIVQTRMQFKPIEFWKPRGLDKLRRAEWVYSPSVGITDVPRAEP